MYPSLNLNTLSINPSNSKIGLKININKNNIGLPIVDFDFCSKKKNAVNNPFKINANDNIPVMFWNKIFQKLYVLLQASISTRKVIIVTTIYVYALFELTIMRLNFGNTGIITNSLANIDNV